MTADAGEPAGLPAEVKVLWGDRARPPRGRPPRLSLEKIVAAAVAVADGDGLPALSMQRLAAELGVGTMSLYRYVDTKAALTALMLDTAIGPPEDYAAAETWRAGLERWAHRNLAVFRRHPWTLSLVTAHRVMGPNETGHLDSALRTISGMGLDATEMLDAVLLVNGFVRGAAHHFAHGARPLAVETLEELGERDRYPALAAVLGRLGTGIPAGYDPERGFEYGLGRILDGLEVRFTGDGERR